MCSDLVDEGGSAWSDGCTAAGWRGALDIEGAFAVDFAEFRMDEVEGY